MPSSAPPRTVALVTLGCARNEVDSEELAGRLAADGWSLVEDPADADAVAGQHLRVRRVGQEGLGRHPAGRRRPQGRRPHPGGRRGRVPGRALRRAARRGAARGRRGARLRRLRRDAATGSRSILAGTPARPARPARPPRCCCPLTPGRPARRGRVGRAARPRRPPARYGSRLGSADLPPPARRRPRRPRSSSPRAATGAAASAPSRRSAAPSCPAGPPTSSTRRAGSPSRASRELFLVSENSTSYGKDLGDLRLLETLLPELAAVDGIERVRVSYLQPAEMRPSLVAGASRARPASSPYFDLSFQHAAPAVLRRMRRFGDSDSFLALLEQVRAARPAGRRPLQRHRRLPGGDRGRPRRARAASSPWPASTWSGCSATPTRTAPRRRSYDDKLDPSTRSPRGSSGCHAWSRS